MGHISTIYSYRLIAVYCKKSTVNHTVFLRLGMGYRMVQLSIKAVIYGYSGDH
jgi:hypothetical protein